MNDAGEVLLTIYELINQGVSALRNYGMAADVDLDAAFGLTVHEYVHCAACDLNTHDSRYTQYFYNTQVGGADKALRAMSDAVWVVQQVCISCIYLRSVVQGH
jgi:hypothetical protein